MLKIPFNEAVDFFLNAGASFSRGIPRPNVSELVDVETPDFIVSAPIVSVESTSRHRRLTEMQIC